MNQKSQSNHKAAIARTRHVAKKYKGKNKPGKNQHKKEDAK